MAELTRGRVQLYVVIGVLIFWGFAIVGAVLDGSEGRLLVRLVTPLATMCFGWLFAQKTTNGA